MLKKIVSMLCACAIAVSCSLGAYAAEDNNDKTVSTTAEVSDFWDYGDASLPIQRISGNNRYETASECVFRTEFIDDARSVILASGESWADALVGVPLSKKLNAPILLTGKKTLNENARYAMNFMFAENVYILGGNGVISKAVEKSLTQGGNNRDSDDQQQWTPEYNVQRFAGKDRYATAVEIAKQLQKDEKTFPETVFFVSISNFADALSVSTVAALMQAPIFYISPTGKLDDVTRKYLKSCNKSIKKAYVIGGEKAIGNAVFKELSPYVANPKNSKTKKVERISGSNRYETCLKINTKFAKLFKNDLCIATGKNFPDALAGGAVAAKKEAPMLLVADSLTASQKSYLNKRQTENFYLFGGYNAISSELETQAVFLGEPKIRLSLSGKNAVVRFNKLPKAKTYEIYRDGKLIKTLKDPKTLSYTDKNINLSVDHSYSVRFKLDKEHYTERSKYTSDYDVVLNSVKLKPRYTYSQVNTQGTRNIVTKQYITNNDIKILKEFAAKHFTKNMTNADKVAYTLNWINKNVVYYDFNNVNHQKKFNEMLRNGTFSYVNAAFRYKLGQCNVYNGALVAMMCYLGYDAQLILGWRGYGTTKIDPKTKKETFVVTSKWQHFWGEVKINGQTYLMEAGNYGQDGNWMYICARYAYAGGYLKNLKPAR